jgi:hypothetical protein
MLAGVLGACWLRNPHVPETPDRIECRCRRGTDLTRLHVEEEVPDSLTSLLLIGVELIERLKAYVKKHAITFVSRGLSLQPACQSLVWQQG